MKTKNPYKVRFYFLMVLVLLSSILFLVNMKLLVNEIDNQKEINALQCELLNVQVELIGDFVIYSNDLVTVINEVTDFNLTQIYSKLKEVEC